MEMISFKFNLMRGMSWMQLRPVASVYIGGARCTDELMCRAQDLLTDRQS